MVTKKRNIHAVSITSNPEMQICGLISFVHFVITKTLKISEQSQNAPFSDKIRTTCTKNIKRLNSCPMPHF